MKIKKDDNIIVIAGKDKGKKGKVIKAIPTLDKVIVEGINIAKRHIKASGGTDGKGNKKKGQIVEVPAPIHVSNVKLAEKKKTAAKKTTKAKPAKK